MKKKLAAVLIAMAFVTGCGGGDPNDLSSYVTLGSIDALSPDFEQGILSEEDIEDSINEDLTAYSDYIVTTEPVTMGDYVQLELTVTEAGEILYDYTGDDFYDMLLGEADWGEEFDEYLVGQRTGDSGSFEISYSDDFMDAGLAGRDVVIDYKITEVDDVIVPEKDDAFAANMGYSSYDEYRIAKVEELNSQTKEDDKERYRIALMEALINASSFKDYPDSLKKEAGEVVEEEYQSFADMFGMELSEVYDTFGLTDEDIESEKDMYAKQRIAVDALIKKYNITVSDSEFDELASEYAVSEDYDSVEEMMEEYGKDELMEYFLTQKAFDLLVEKNPM